METFKKPRAAFSKGSARAILLCKGDPDIDWLEREVENLCRSRCLPLTLKSNEFMKLLGILFETRHALEILSDLRTRYAAAHPFMVKADAEVEAVLAGVGDIEKDTD